ncbi:MAG: hypothetical protein IKP28_04570 [Clostridia bacterium]|nr:hypothetical protein [Clostridia bacterium]
MKRILTVILILILIISIIHIFLEKNYNSEKIGNTMIKQNDIQAYILNISSYEAIADITVTNGKTTNNYKVKQNERIDGLFEQEVIEPKIIERNNNKI